MADRQVIRIQKVDSAWVYHVLEAQDGIVSYSTVPDPENPSQSDLSPEGFHTCLLELTIPVGFREQVQSVLDHLKQSGVWIHELSYQRDVR